ncbi:MAG: sodium-dependent transporter [Chromatiales bacterium]|nr:sodium-dependent transporter [Chromatiales bacterium]
MSVPGGGQRTSLHGFWSSRLAFILAVTGSAVGLGNIWKFPYMTGEYGGSAFVLVYLGAVLLVGLPIMMSEILIGRRGRRNPVTTMRLLGQEESGSSQWQWVGALGIMGGFLILSFYGVIAGWTVAYVFEAARGAFAGAGAAEIDARFSALEGSALRTGFWHTLFMLLTILIVARGVERGLEQAVRVMVPGLLVIMVVLLVYAAGTGAFGQAAEFMFRPDFSALDGTVILAALGQAFFSLSIGMACVMAYGAYLPQDASIGRTSLAVVAADTSIALLAGMVIFPIVFANGLDPADGIGLVFKTLPIAFGSMGGGVLIGMLFFLLLSFAALTSAISLMEPTVAWVMESRGVNRGVAATIVGVLIWLLGFATVFSFNLLQDFRFLRGTLFANIDFLTSNIMLPLGGLLVTLFAGWFMSSNSTSGELDPQAGTGYQLWRILVRWVTPAAVIIVFLNSIGLLDLA